ncbi:MAG: DUF692 domain-containing protein [Geminicoccaceae bacterium]
MSDLPSAAAGLPARAGIGLKLEHADEILATRPAVGFFEVHAENFMGAGGPPHRWLTAIRERYPLSLHGVGLSIGGAGPLDRAHLAKLSTLCDRYEPASFSEHLAWSSHGPCFLNDLLPIAYDRPTLRRICVHVDEVQSVLRRQMLLENPSTYLELAASTMDEVGFIAEVAARTGCGLLLDVSNVRVSTVNHGGDAHSYLARFPLGLVAELHLGGYALEQDATGAPLLIDDHGSAVAEEVWDLFTTTVARCGPLPTLIEWDNDVPALPVLVAEAQRADRILAKPSMARRVA